MDENKFSFKHYAEKAAALGGAGSPADKSIASGGCNMHPVVGDEIVGGPGFAYAQLIPGDAEEIQMTPQQVAAGSLRNAKDYMQRVIKSGALSQHDIEAIDHAEAIMQMVLDNLKKQELPPEFSYHMANAVNELQACTKLCTGNLQASVFDLSAAVEKLRGDYE